MVDFKDSQSFIDACAVYYDKCFDIQNKEMDQYKEAVRTLNKELTAITEKLKQESNVREKAQRTRIAWRQS